MSNILIIASLFVLPGCGGGGSGSTGSPTGSATSVVGRWAGPWSTTAGQVGVYYIDINSNGTVLGTSISVLNENTDQFTGTITNAGVMSVTWPGGSSTITVSLNSSGQLIGPTIGSGGVVASQVLNSISTGSAVQYAGALNGTWSDKSGDTGSAVLVDDGNGKVTLQLGNPTNNSTFSAVGALNGNGTIANSGALDITVGGENFSGTVVKGASNSVKGSLTGTGSAQGKTLSVSLTLS